MSSRANDRQRSFKKGIDTDATRRRREDTAIQIRKSIKDDRLNQRRRMVQSVADLPKIAAMIQSLDTDQQTEATQLLRRLLSLAENPPIQDVINLGVVPILVDFLKRQEAPNLQFEAAWALTNIASGTTQHTEELIRHNAVPTLCQLMLSPHDNVCEQAVWALGNISGDSPECRDFVLNSGAMTMLIMVLRNRTGNISILRNATWTLSNFCRGKPKPDFHLVQPALNLLPHLIYSPDEEVVTDACWTLSYLSEGPNERIQAVIEAGVCRQLVELLGHSLTAVQTPALRSVGNIVTGDEHQTQTILDLGALPRLLPLLKHQKKLIRKETCWTISNITAGTQSQIQEVLDANIVPLLLHQLLTGEFDVKKEAAWAISNATNGGSPDQVKFLVQQGCIPPLDSRIIHVCLDALDQILRVGEVDSNYSGENQMATYVEEADGIELIQNLQFHEEEDIYAKAMKIIQDYFEGDDDEDYALEPDVSYDAKNFQFGLEGNGNQPGAVFDFNQP
ncbi:TPA: hypothetical protein N0F65_003013 [Lagenidium giganteum]|uniref:Importin subunit alpha n=1 Tax=Lagenidium giganteum TaxID=4803 RepID=A0AAV2YWG1_9STRA|nr:TPA: hypothetical protein N0F65_003013 [Lagenidium giganteum]